MEVDGKLRAPAALPPGKENVIPTLDRRLGGPQSLTGCPGEEKNSQPLSGLEPPIIQSVAQRYTIELSVCTKASVAYHTALLCSLTHLVLFLAA
jgi:hypothetical protein